jgi:protein O-mannosyl-transferase
MKKEQKQAKKAAIKPENQILKRIVIFAILLVNLIVFYPSTKCGFIDWDDTVYVTENPNLALNSKNVSQSFTKGETHGVYAPLTALSLSMNYTQAKMNPKPYHMTNIIIHLITVLLVFFMLFLLSKNLLFTAIVTLFFSLHPAQVESVTYIAGRRDLLFSLFAIASMLLYIKYKLKQKSSLYWFSIGCFLLSLLSKTQALLFPFLLFGVDFFLNLKVTTRKNIAEKIPYFILMIVFGIVAVAVKQASPEFKITDEALEFPFFYRVLFGLWGYVLYIYEVLIPNHLSLIHPYPNAFPGYGYLGVVLACGVLYWCYWLFKHNKKTTLFGVLFFSVNLVLMLQFFPNSYGLLNDHYLYLPILGIGILIAHFALSLNPKYRKIALGFIGIYIAVLTISTVNRIAVFSDPIAVNTDVIEKYPDSYVAYNNRGSAYYKKTDLEHALQDYNQAIELFPKSAYSLNNRSVIYLTTGKFELAMADLNKAISIKPDYADAYSNRAITKTYTKDTTILADHNKAIELKPNNPKYYYNRGAYYLQTNHPDLGCNDVQKSRKLGMKQGNPMVDRMCP